MKPLARLSVLAAVTAGLGACQTLPPANPDLEAARSTLAEARANAYAARAAAVDLERAQTALRSAESAWADRRDRDETRHLAYLARRRAEIALALASQSQSDERLQRAGAERERARLEARTREAEAAARVARTAQADAQTAQAQARSAQAQAQTAEVQAQTAQSSAEAARSQAERARLEAEATRQQLALQADATRQQAERAAALERDLLALQARPTPRGMVVTLGDVLFATGRDELQPGALRSVQQIAVVLRQYPERRVLVEGFTDSVGSESYNLDLSRRRADAFRRALLDAGVSAERIEVQALGKAYPVADNTTAAGRQQNRRVEVLFSDGQGRFASR